ncbi:hypothetical protein BH09PSE5_BH09PSE5_46300 [soil metagenome]
MTPLRTFGEALTRWVYSAFLWLLQPAYLLRLWFRGRAEPLYRYAWGERLGHYSGSKAFPKGSLGLANGRIRVEPRGTPVKPANETGWLWVHAVSLGETRAAAARSESLRESRPGMRLLLTHVTATCR